MPAVEDRPISEFPRATEVLSTALLEISNPDGLGGYDTLSAVLTEVGRAILAVAYTQQLGNVSVFDAIKNCRVLSGTATPTSQDGADGQFYGKYQTVSNVDSVVAMYFKLNGEWLEISLGGGSGASWTDVTGTLTAGSTSITLSDASISSSSTIDIYTDTYGVNPTSVAVSAGSVVLTFEAQQSDVAVKVRAS